LPRPCSSRTRPWCPAQERLLNGRRITVRPLAFWRSARVSHRRKMKRQA
jgi:hypothetical protein